MMVAKTPHQQNIISMNRSVNIQLHEQIPLQTSMNDGTDAADNFLTTQLTELKKQTNA